MEKIRIGKEKRRYEISSIRPESANILEIVFIDAIPAIWGNITIYTEDGTEATTLTGYETVYKQDGQTVELSNDGSVYTPPASPEPAEPPGPYVPTLEEVKNGSYTWGAAAKGGGETEDGLVDINTADAALLMTLPGIGQTRADAIVAYREQHGSFSTIEDIMKVDGIKEGSFAKLRDRITVRQ